MGSGSVTMYRANHLSLENRSDKSYAYPVTESTGNDDWHMTVHDSKERIWALTDKGYENLITFSHSASG
ncbi:hypothetical protein Y032_0061g3206 [Ancylostoma ceylanicum]|uniref:Uncharacterized protein n=1 Tax=Ancylostoma ceylanicum TaxID=53326 RepID=A0A016U2V3_9BILA|nr:hypothetical protein Y032_0061g3206 [Ancylostoma ceylanicum]